MEQRSEKMKTLVSSFINLLQTESQDYSTEKREALEVAIQCLENAFDLDAAARENLQQINLLDVIVEKKDEVIDPEKAEKCKHLGNQAMISGQYDEALTHYTEAIKYNGRNAVYYGNRAAAFTRLDKNREAIEDCKKAVSIDPTYGKAYNRLGIAYSNLHMYEEARNAYKTALTVDPTNPMYRENMNFAQERIFATMERAAPPEHRPRDLREFVNSEAFLNLAREMVNSSDFNSIMSGIMAMGGQSGEFNFETFLQAGSNLAYQLRDPDQNMTEDLARQASAPSMSTSTSTDPPRTMNMPEKKPDDGKNGGAGEID